MLSATSHIELETLLKFLNMSSMQNGLYLYQRVPLQMMLFQPQISSLRKSVRDSFYLLVVKACKIAIWFKVEFDENSNSKKRSKTTKFFKMVKI